jgi:hypothetical protein
MVFSPSSNLDQSRHPFSSDSQQKNGLGGLPGLHKTSLNTEVILNYREKVPLNAGADVIPLYPDIDELKVQIHRANNTIHHLNQKILSLSSQLDIANQQTVTAQKLAANFAHRPKPSHEPSRQPSTYIVPQRERSSRVDRLMATIPFSMLLLAFAVGLTAAFIIAMPALWVGISPFVSTLIRGLFLVIAVATILSLALEICRYHTA